MDTGLAVAIIAGAVALASAGISWRTQLAVTDRKALRDRELKDADRQSEAAVVLDRYRGPLLDAAWLLGDRIDNIRNRGFLGYVGGGDRAQDARLSTLSRIGIYLGWREYLRLQVQLMRFESDAETRLVAGFLGDIAWALATDKVDEGRAMLWADEQRGIGELMLHDPSAGSPGVRGYASFCRDYDEIFAPWMERLATDLFSPRAVRSDRLRLLQWALYGLVRRLDTAGAYGGTWLDRTQAEISRLRTDERATRTEIQLRQHLALLRNG
ncbi:hypothetical protein [Solirubrobacter soli]|uniref:hypothetical protein n=1 Tax=Solirubrobacter soli TaxID=363832 RepID=UPI0004817CD7|nr:hypothetical protein [Solirubrobacter soli]